MNALPTVDRPAVPTMRSDLRMAGLLGLASGIATALLFPYLQLVMPEQLAKLPISLPVVVVLQSLQATVLLGLLAFCGLRMGHAVGLGVPWLQAWIARREKKTQPWLLAVACGALAAIAVLGLDPLFAAAMPAPLHPLPAQPAGAHAFAGFLASFYGGIAEEIMLRLFFVTLLAWGLSRFTGGRVAAWQLVLAVLVASLAFGAGHLPAAAKLWPLDAIVVSRTLLLNGIAGLVFGWFYVRHGLESAIVSHFSADLVLHVAAPLAMA